MASDNKVTSENKGGRVGDLGLKSLKVKHTMQAAHTAQNLTKYSLQGTFAVHELVLKQTKKNIYMLIASPSNPVVKQLSQSFGTGFLFVDFCSVQVD